VNRYVLGTIIGVTAFTLVGGAVAVASSGNGVGLPGGFGREQMLESKADILGMTTEELETQLEGSSFAELLDEQGVTHAELQERMHAQMQERMTQQLQQMVDDGTITETEKQERLQNMEERQAACEESGDCGMHGKGFGMRGSRTDSNGDGVCDYQDGQDN